MKPGKYGDGLQSPVPGTVSTGVILLLLVIFFTFIHGNNLYASAVSSQALSSSSGDEKTLTINAEMQFEYAMDRFHNHDYETAIVELGRFIYFFPSDARVREAKLKKGMALFQLKRFREALNTLEPLSIPDSGDGIYADALFMLCSTFLAMNRDGSAETMLQNLLLLNREDKGGSDNEKNGLYKGDPKDMEDKESTMIEDHALYSLAWIYINRAEKVHDSVDGRIVKLRSALKYLDGISSSGLNRYNAVALKQEIGQTMERMLEQQKSPAVSGLMSMLPGGGFAYCNRYHDALAALLINGALIYASVEAFDDGNQALGALLGTIELGFYGGNIYGGISSAHKHNRDILNVSTGKLRQRYPAALPQPGGEHHDFGYYNKNEEKKNNSIKIPLLSITIPF